MQVVSDVGMDLSPEQLAGLNIHTVPLLLTLEGKTYRSGIDIQPAEFYEMLDATEAFPTTSQPSAGDFAALYRELAKNDPDILSVHISSGLSGTANAARTGAGMVPEAKVTIVDTKTLSCPEGWQVEAAARAAKAGWPVERILPLLAKIGAATEGLFTLPTLKYLVHGGRISHLTGLVAQMLNIKPVIGVDKEDGRYMTVAREVTLKRAMGKIAEHLAQMHGEGTPMRIQLLHGHNPEAVAFLKEKLEAKFPCTFLPQVTVTPVLGAHTGAGLVGLAAGPLAAYADIP